MTYAALAAATTETLQSATPNQLEHNVPWTPLWSVQDVLAHLIANAERASTGIASPPTDDEAHQAVLARRDNTIADLLSIWQAVSPQVVLPDRGPSQEWDLAVHLADIHETLELPPLPADLWRPVLLTTMGFLHHIGRLAKPIASPAGTWGDGPVAATTTDYELFRAVFGRRTAETLAPATDGDPEAITAIALF